MDPVHQHTDRDLIRDKRSLIHERFGFLAEFCTRLDVCAENISGGDVRNAVLRRNSFCLSSFTGTGGAEHDDLHSFPPLS